MGLRNRPDADVAFASRASFASATSLSSLGRGTRMRQSGNPARAEVDGEQVDVRAFVRARKLLDTLPHGFAVPEVGMDPDGEIALDWIRSDRTMVSLSIGPTGDLSYAAHLRDGTADGVIRLKEGFPPALTELLRRLYHPA